MQCRKTMNQWKKTVELLHLKINTYVLNRFIQMYTQAAYITIKF